MANPTLAGGNYGRYITMGRPVYWVPGSQTVGIIFISDGGRYGLDQIDGVEYKGESIGTEGTNWIFHRGTIPLQIVPFDATVNHTTDVVTATGHPFANGDPVRLSSIEGDVPVPVSKDTKYFAGDVSGATFKLYAEVGLSTLIDLTTAGTGQVIVWKANTGFDDPDQGLPTFCPEVGTTFNNIAYIEFKLPAARSSVSEEPDWQDFRIFGIGRRLRDYNAAGVEGAIVTDNTLLSNVALQLADNFIVNFKGKPERIDWTSWFALRTSANVDIWQRSVVDDDVAEPSGLTGRYYQDQVFENLIITRIDATVNMGDVYTVDPAPGVDGANNFCVRWDGKIMPEFSENYTFSIVHDDTVKLWIDGTLIIDDATAGTSTDSTTFNMVAGQLYTIRVEMTQITIAPPNNWACRMSWSSASQSSEIVPSDRLFPADEQVKRYECHTAFATPTEASDVHERIMTLVPGWDWTDRDGLIEFLPPDRPTVFAFAFDKIDDDSRANFEKHTLIKKRKPMVERKNFLLFRFRNVRDTGYPFAFVQADREELRFFTNGEPTNDPAEDLGVATRSLAERVAEMRMVIMTDPDHTMNLSGGRASTVIRKNDFVTVSYYDNDENFVADAKYMVIFHAWGAKNEKNDYILLPIPDPFYTDEIWIAP